LPTKESIVFEELDCLLVVLEGGHDEHLAFLGLGWDHWDCCAVVEVFAGCGNLVGVQLSFEEPLSEYLKECLL